MLSILGSTDEASVGEEGDNCWDGLSDDEMSAMRSLPPSRVSEADLLLLSACTQDWQKVARVLGQLLDVFEHRFAEVPLEFLSYRLQELEAEGVVAIHGDPFLVRESEVRLISLGPKGLHSAGD